MNQWLDNIFKSHIIGQHRNVLQELHVKPEIIFHPEVNHVNDWGASRCHSHQRSTSPIQRKWSHRQWWTSSREIHARDQLLVPNQVPTSQTKEENQQEKQEVQEVGQATPKKIQESHSGKHEHDIIHRRTSSCGWEWRTFRSPNTENPPRCPSNKRVQPRWIIGQSELICTSYLLNALAVSYPWNMAASRHPTEVIGKTTDVQQPGGKPNAMWHVSERIAGIPARSNPPTLLPHRTRLFPVWVQCVTDTGHIHSEKNTGRLYCKCPKRTCKFFQWIDEPPRGLAEELLIKSHCERVAVKIKSCPLKKQYFFY